MMGFADPFQISLVCMGDTPIVCIGDDKWLIIGSSNDLHSSKYKIKVPQYSERGPLTGPWFNIKMSVVLPV